MENRPKLVIILSRFPYPLEKGDKLRAYHQIVELSNQYDIYLFCLSDEEISSDRISQIESFCKEIHVYHLSKARIFLRLCFNTFKSTPFQVAYFYNRKIGSEIQKKIREIAPAHIFCQLIRVASYVKDLYEFPKTLDYMDSLSKGIEKRVNLAPFYSKWLFKLEYSRLRKFEIRMFDYFDHKTIISEADRTCILHPDREQIQIIPNGVDKSFFEKVETEVYYDLVFVGNLSYAPNVETTEYIDRFLVRYPHYKALIAGASPTSRVIKATTRNQLIELGGWYEDIRFAYCSGKIFFAPLFIGTGMQNKLLEAMALGIPCITTPQPAEAIGAKHLENILVGNTQEQFKEYIDQLLHNQELYQSITINAKVFIKKEYSWKNSVQSLIKLISNS
jgi:glycosyltransferase involved in cell wall biosynthesis